MRITNLVLLLLSLAVPLGATTQGPSLHPKVAERSVAELAKRDFMSVCPPFFLRDETGQIIDPVHGSNAQQPYSSKQTCGACHDYDLITQGFHFQVGSNETITAEQARLYPWMSSPGQYGGRY